MAIISLLNGDGVLLQRIDGALIIRVVLNIDIRRLDIDRIILGTLFNDTDNTIDRSISIITVSLLIIGEGMLTEGDELVILVEESPFNVLLLEDGEIDTSLWFAWISIRSDWRWITILIDQIDDDLRIVENAGITITGSVWFQLGDEIVLRIGWDNTIKVFKWIGLSIEVRQEESYGSSKEQEAYSPDGTASVAGQLAA